MECRSPDLCGIEFYPPKTAFHRLLQIFGTCPFGAKRGVMADQPITKCLREEETKSLAEPCGAMPRGLCVNL